MIVVWTLALNTFREAVRDRVLHSMLFFCSGDGMCVIGSQRHYVGRSR